MTELKPNLIVPFEDMQRLFDMVVSSMDFSSGFLETDDVNLLRSIAGHIGVDPMDATPNTFKAHYKHTFKPRTEESNQYLRNQLAAYKADLAAINDASPYTYHHPDAHARARDAATVSIIRAQNLLERRLNECEQCQTPRESWPHQED